MALARQYAEKALCQCPLMNTSGQKTTWTRLTEAEVHVKQTGMNWNQLEKVAKNLGLEHGELWQKYVPMKTQGFKKEEFW